jgi:4-amino-4-deoxy-L-arabinose transferase-like glycosyltransferase
VFHFTRSKILFLLAWLVIFVMLLAHSMLKHLDHDEHQFIASAVLLARERLLPYRDYPYFHMPYLIGIYAILFQFTDHLLLAARLFSMVCAFLILVLIGFAAGRLFAEKKPRVRIFLQASILLISIANPLFSITSGRSWNHDLPTLLTLAAFLLICRATRDKTKFTMLIIAGGLMGIAIGTRLTFAPAALVMPLALLFQREINIHDRFKQAAGFIFGLMICLIPAGIIFVLAPRQFIFGNLKYPIFNTSFRAAQNYHGAITILAKLTYLLELALLPANAVLLFICIVSVVVVWRRRIQEHRWFEIRLLLLLIFALIIAGLAPAPLFSEYFYTPMLFILIAAMYCVATLEMTRRWAIIFAAAALISLPYIVIEYHDIMRLSAWRDWVPMQVHQEGEQIAIAAGHGRVLTLAPIFPLEGHAEIYPELATGPFAWRVAPLVSESEESTMHELDVDDLDAALMNRPPTAVVLGLEIIEDKELLAYALRHNTLVIDVRKESAVQWSHRESNPDLLNAIQPSSH